MNQMDPTEWLREFLREYREIYNGLTPEQRAQRQFSLCDFNQPCEIHWIRFVNPVVQVIIVRHLPSQHGDDLQVYGPIAYADGPERLEEILSSATFQRSLTPEGLACCSLGEEEAIFRRAVETFLLQLFNNPVPQVSEPLSEREDIVTSRMTLGGGNFGWLVVGDLSELSPTDAAQKIFPPEKVAREKAEPAAKAVASCCGTYFYPPVWIRGPVPETFKDKTRGGLVERASKVVLRSTYGGQEIFVTHAGLVAVACESNEDVCHRLNELMLGAIFEGLSAHLIHLREIADIDIDLERGAMAHMSGGLVSPRMWQGSGLGLELTSALSLLYQRVDVERLKEVLATATKLAEAIPPDWISLFLTGYTHYENLEYTQSFLMLWLIVEQSLNELLSRAVKTLTKKRQKKLKKKFRRWSADHCIEILNLMNRLSDSEYYALMAFKGKRNDIVHKVRFVDKQDTEPLVEYVKEMFASRLL